MATRATADDANRCGKRRAPRLCVFVCMGNGAIFRIALSELT